MPEAFLHYIWQFQYFDKRDLVTIQGERIEIIRPGMLNRHAGPDFNQAQISIDGISWAGSVEIHLLSSGWYQHGHERDHAYEQVVLHVVWENDRSVVRTDGTILPTLEIKDRVSESLMQEYRKLVGNPAGIPCHKSFPTVPRVVVESMIDKAMVQRLEEKASLITGMYHRNKGSWDETAYQLLARNFGFKINADPFYDLARSLPLRYLQKHASQPVQVEAMLFGQAGFLEEEVGDEYYRLLQREYHVLSTKYSLKPGRLKKSRWRFLRMRPANFPTIRLAQFAALVTRHPQWLSQTTATSDLRTLKNLIAVEQSAYWQSHYQFNRPTSHRLTAMGDTSVENILINSVIPLWVAMGLHSGDPAGMERALALLQRLASEENSILSHWEALGWKVQTALESQGLIEMYNHYCQQRNCLNCAIGAALLKPAR